MNEDYYRLLQHSPCHTQCRWYYGIHEVVERNLPPREDSGGTKFLSCIVVVLDSVRFNQLDHTNQA